MLGGNGAPTKPSSCMAGASAAGRPASVNLGYFSHDTSSLAQMKCQRRDGKRYSYCHVIDVGGIGHGLHRKLSFVNSSAYRTICFLVQDCISEIVLRRTYRYKH